MRSKKEILKSENAELLKTKRFQELKDLHESIMIEEEEDDDELIGEEDGYGE